MRLRPLHVCHAIGKRFQQFRGSGDQAGVGDAFWCANMRMQDSLSTRNAFDLLPGETVTLTVDSKADPAALRKALQLRSLYGATVAAP